MKKIYICKERITFLPYSFDIYENILILFMASVNHYIHENNEL